MAGETGLTSGSAKGSLIERWSSLCRFIVSREGFRFEGAEVGSRRMPGGSEHLLRGKTGAEEMAGDWET